MIDSSVSLELATLDDIATELGNRSACGRFVFIYDNDILVGKDLTPEDLYKLAKMLDVIAEHIAIDVH